MTSTPPPPRPSSRINLPAGMFAPHRRPAFLLLDPIGDPVEVDRALLEDCEGEIVSIAPVDAEAFRTYLRLHVHEILAMEMVPLADRAWAAHRAVLHEVASLLGPGADGRANALLDACRSLASFMSDHRDPDGLFHLLRVDASYTPVVHGTETAIGAVAVALADGQRNIETLATLAAAGAVADAGLLDLPRKMRERRDPLAPMEWKALQRHPELSLRRMHVQGMVAPEAVHAVRYHHERWDGSGYPDGLEGSGIPVEARYVAIADAYSALTVAHGDRARLSRGDALREMARSTGQFDPALLRILVHLLTDAAVARAA